MGEFAKGVKVSFLFEANMIVREELTKGTKNREYIVGILKAYYSSAKNSFSHHFTDFLESEYGDADGFAKEVLALLEKSNSIEQIGESEYRWCGK